MPKRTDSSAMQRRQIAAEAARIMATEGQLLYLTAKQKAADRLGVKQRQTLPSNAEVAAELKSYLQVFGGREREQAVHDQLKTAIEAMTWLQDFEPKLSGALAEGLANVHTPIKLHLFSDDPDAPLRHLLDRNFPYQQEQKSIRWHNDQHRTIECLSFQAGDWRVELWLFDRHDQRQAPPSPIDGKAQRRLSVAAVEALLQEQRQRL
ncbi:MAG: hypothetical protein Tsb002_12200 [Wenzhouxiangellaceae bacterium]